MTEDIFLLHDNNLIELTEQEYDSEELLQKYLAEYPRLIPGGLIDSDNPRKWVLISREMGVAAEEEAGDRWAVDHLFVDQDAIPTIWKCEMDDSLLISNLKNTPSQHKNRTRKSIISA